MVSVVFLFVEGIEILVEVRVSLLEEFVFEVCFKFGVGLRGWGWCIFGVSVICRG